MVRSPLGFLPLAKVGRVGILMAAGLVPGALCSSVAYAQAPAAQAPAAQAAASPFVFNSDAGVVLYFIKPDKTEDFEMVIGKLKEALAKSDNPIRKQQAAGWKYFKSPDMGPNGLVIYVSVMDPVAKGSDYSVGQALVDGFGAEGQDLYKKYSETFGMPSLNLIHMNNLMDMK
jgi:hypothetical protein